MQKQIEYNAVPVESMTVRAKKATTKFVCQLGLLGGAIGLADAYMFHGAVAAGLSRAIYVEPSHHAVATLVEPDVEPEPDVELEAQRILEERFRIPRAVWVTLARRESGFSMYASRFEPGQMKNVKHLTPDPHEQRWYASSHGRFQVMGFHVPRLREKYGLDITEQGLAFDPRQNALAAGTILSECFRDSRVQKHKQNRERLRALFACFNGAGPRAEAYADAAMKELSSELLNDVEIDIAPAHDELPKKAKKTEIAALRPEENEPFVAEGRE
jgi:hypothetical protein